MDLYFMLRSPPCRSVLMTGRAVGVEFNLIPTNLRDGDHLTEKFLKMNPQHEIPTLDDGGFTLGESRAIMIYLVGKYGKDNDDLYPKDAQKRGLITSRLFFDMSLYQCYANYWFPQLFTKTPPDEDSFRKMKEAMAIFNEILSRSKYAAGENLTLADLSLVATTSSYDVSGFDFRSYPKVAEWYEDCKTNIEGYEELNQKGADELRLLFK